MPSSKPHTRSKPADTQNHRVLRIGVILGGKIVEERLLRERKDVTIGQSAKNTFSIPLETLPRSWALFTVHDNRYSLCLADNMDGRVSSDGGEVRTMAALKSGRAQKRGDAWVIPLEDSARGKIVLGSMTLLFQFVIEPPRQPRPHLPASVRGTFSERLDPMLTIILALSLFIHLSIVVWAFQHDPVVTKRTTRIFNETFQRPTVAIEDIHIPTADENNTGEDKKDEPEKGDDKEPKGKQPKKQPGDDADSGRSAEDRVKLEEEARRYAENLLADTFSNRGVGGGASDRDARNDLGQAIDEIKSSGARVEVGGDSRRGTRGDGSSQLGTGKGPNVEGPGDSTTKTDAKTAEKVPRTRVKVGGGSTDDDTTLRPDDVLRKIRTSYMEGLKRCHKDLLKREPTASGTVNLRFMIGETGRVVRVKASGFDPGVDRCIEQRAQSWRFGIPKDKDGEPTDATFEVALALQAE